MVFINIILVSLLAFLGLVFGMFLAFFTKEELKPGRKYFGILLKAVTIVLIVMLITKSLNNYLLLSIAFILGMIISFIFRKNYFYLGFIIVGSSFLGDDFFSLISGLVFLFGLPFGTMIASNNLNKIKKLYNIVVSNFILYAIPFLVLFFGNLIQNYTNIIFAFSSGALFVFLVSR
ncbi:hypothetical protein HYX18_04815 [Candidatus Woesearchaeota archaeon]|nr:hypothetical protein [Candidatus Woesearchaeota archaeon]